MTKARERIYRECATICGKKEERCICIYVFWNMHKWPLEKHQKQSHGCFQGEDQDDWRIGVKKRHFAVYSLMLFVSWATWITQKEETDKIKKKKKKDRKTWLIVIYTNGSLFFSHKKEPKVSAYCWFNGSVMPNEPGSFFSSRTSVLRGLAFYLHGCFFMLLRWLHSSGIRRKDKENQKLFPNDAFWPGNKTSLYMSWARNGS